MEKQSVKILKSIHDDVHCGITSTQRRLRRLRLVAWWPSYSPHVKKYIKRFKMCTEKENSGRQKRIHSQKCPYLGTVHIDQANINGVWLLLILGDSYSGLARNNIVFQKRRSTVKQALWIIFSRYKIPKTLASDNAPELCDPGLCQWLKKIASKPYKTPLNHPNSNGVAERMV